MPSRLPLVLGMLAAMGCAVMSAGCAGSRWNFFRPGTVEQQQLRATVHDPYPDVDAGPEVVGGRPRDYAQPLPEPVRNRIYADSWWAR
ncbi:MAG: hypothetical protein L0211_16905 [Planctomycetaceae bacterium]|nr:hypothetical protein [Planctomycetaceae bacterium]